MSPGRLLSGFGVVPGSAMQPLGGRVMRKLALLAAVALGGVSVPALALPVIDYAPDSARGRAGSSEDETASSTGPVSELHLGNVIIPLGRGGKIGDRTLANFRIPAGIYTFRWQAPPEKARIDPGFVLLNTVPEPQTWALTILGFGLTGGAIRIRRRFSRSFLRLER